MIIRLMFAFLLGLSVSYVHAETLDQQNAQQSSNCVPTPSDPCADISPILKLGESLNKKPLAGKGEIKNTSILVNQSEAGMLPSDSSGKTMLAPRASSATKKTTLKLTNNSSFAIYWRVFAWRGGPWYWPSASTAWTQKSRSTVSKTITCNSGETLWFGATDTTFSYYWGIGVNGNESCNWSSCSSTCDGKTHILTITN